MIIREVIDMFVQKDASEVFAGLCAALGRESSGELVSATVSVEISADGKVVAHIEESFVPGSEQAAPAAMVVSETNLPAS